MSKTVLTQGSAAMAALCLLLCLENPAHAAVPVEESVEESRSDVGVERQTREVRPLSRRATSLDIPPTIEPAAQPVQQTGTGAAGNGVRPATPGNASGSRTDMFYQLQILQQEIQDLRGQVEEQAYTIKRLQTDQKQQYLDLDRRVAALSGGAGIPGTSGQATSPSTNPQPAGITGNPANERDAYRQAFDAMRAKRFEESRDQFQKLIARYPNGQYTANAFYWIGEIFLVADQDAEQARQSFMQVVNLYPDHQKTPDALYKLGVVHAALGESDTARNYLNRVQREHPDSSAAGLARQYLSELR